MTQPPVVFFTCDKSQWIVPAALRQMEKYWNPLPERVIVAGYSKPGYSLPKWAEFESIGRMHEYPANKWSDGVKLFWQRHAELEFATVMLEDYLIIRQVDVPAIELIYQYAQGIDGLVRFDLCTDRLYAENVMELGSLGWLDLLEAPEASYQISLQPSIWNREKMMELLKEGESAWEFELTGSNRMVDEHPDWRVIGTRQAPIRHKIAINKGVFDIETNWQVPPAVLSQTDVIELQATGQMPKRS